MTRPNRNMVRTNLYLPRKLKDAMAKLAKRQGRSYSEMIRQVMTAYIKAEIDKIKKNQ